MGTVATNKRSWVKPAVAAAVLLALLGGGFALFSSSTPAPDVTFITLKGQKVTTESLRGRVVMVNFWATSCATCVKEMPQMVDTYNKFKGQGLEFVAVTMAYDPPNYVVNFAETRKLPFKVAMDTSGEIAKAFGDVTLTPTTFLIDKEGKIIRRYVGEPDFNALHELLQKALAG
ncbi:peroxiredoxin family protein [Massilia glaciei]|uniref:TlpA family protein disulfide reductase n=1 Tax=Massilia glaciei TaxID=1524097 RepID=A0A2U2HFW2_9BURK|nr:TlpA disulfide reductase family protein [Massilia glaciei]PWF43362.1 TlpA family protein disulfide reductase [Massilia glaciei]